MQMYLAKFARNIDDRIIDVAEIVVCAHSRDAALALVVQTFDLPPSSTQFEIRRVKPSIYQVSRRRIDNSMSTHDAQRVSAHLA